jgi:exodeoxyribonuclease VII small subunit
MSDLDGRHLENGAHDGTVNGQKGKRGAKSRHAPDVETLSFEDAQAELDSVVATLEAGEIDLDRSLALYERGVSLARHCQALLDSARLRVERLRVTSDGLDDGDGFSVETWAPTDE